MCFVISFSNGILLCTSVSSFRFQDSKRLASSRSQTSRPQHQFWCLSVNMDSCNRRLLRGDNVSRYVTLRLCSLIESYMYSLMRRQNPMQRTGMKLNLIFLGGCPWASYRFTYGPLPGWKTCLTNKLSLSHR